MTPSQRKQIEKIFRNFLARRYASVRKLDLQSLQINPVFLCQLAEQLRWTSARDIINFLVDETFQRGIVTSAGFQMEKIAKVFGQPTAVRGIDFELHKPRPDGGLNTFYVQVKAGPNTIHEDTAVAIERNFNYALRRNPSAVPIVGITYGDASQANSFTQKLMQRFQVLFGKDFWAFISDDPNCLGEIYEISRQVASNFAPTYRRKPVAKTLEQLLSEKVEELTQQWEDKYGQLNQNMWAKLLQ